MENLDSFFISSLLNCKGNKDNVKDIFINVKEESILGIERNVYKFIKEHFVKTKGLFPSEQLITSKFPTFVIEKVSDPVSVYVEEIFSRGITTSITDSFKKIKKDLLVSDANSAKDKILKLAVDLAKKEEKDITLANTYKSRVKSYVKAKRAKGIVGYKTGIETFDKLLGGLTDDYVAIVGRPGIGKTFLLTKFITGVWSNCNKPLVVISNEMTVSGFGNRFDAIVAGINPSLYRKGLLSKADEKKLVALDAMYEKNPQIYMFGSKFNLAGLEAFVVGVGAGAVFCDGIYLSRMGFNDRYKDTVAASTIYQNIAKNLSIPTIVTAQLQNDADIKYARAVQEDVDVFLRLKQPPALAVDKVMQVDSPKMRNDDSGIKIYLNWDFEKPTEFFTEADYSIADSSKEMQND